MFHYFVGRSELVNFSIPRFFDVAPVATLRRNRQFSQNKQAFRHETLHLVWYKILPSGEVVCRYLKVYCSIFEEIKFLIYQKSKPDFKTSN